jgi:hypothetical protein
VASLRERAVAKVVGSIEEVVAGSWGGLAARVEGGGRLDVEKGLAAAVAEEPEVEKGFADDEDLDGFTPKSNAPMLVGATPCGGGDEVEAAANVSVFAAPLTRTPRSARTLPSFRRQAFCRQIKMYRRLSWPGNLSGKSPLSSRRRLRRELQTLHLANAPEGGEASSNHVYTRLLDE